jgi:hypothetical protein
VSYRGVSCMRCGESIPVSARVASLQDEIAQGVENAPHAFAARCQMCEQESVYEMKDLQRFDGEPRIRLTKARTMRRMSFRSAWQ